MKACRDDLAATYSGTDAQEQKAESISFSTNIFEATYRIIKAM